MLHHNAEQFRVTLPVWRDMPFKIDAPPSDAIQALLDVRGIGVERLRDAPPEWSRQFETLGLNPQ